LNLRRIAVLVAAVVPAVAFGAAAVNVSPASADTSAVNVTACAGDYVYFLPDGTSDHSWAATSSPYTLYYKDDGSSKTEFLCEKVANTSNDFEFKQKGTQRCLYINIGSSRVIDEGACNSNNAQWQLNSQTGPDDYLVESLDNLTCIYDAGSQSPATYNPCKAGETGENGDVISVTRGS
jgi:hypothetical protein